MVKPRARRGPALEALPCLLVLGQVVRLEVLSAGADGGDRDQRDGPGKQRGEEGEAGLGQGCYRRQVETLAIGQLNPHQRHAQVGPRHDPAQPGVGAAGVNVHDRAGP